MTSEHVRRALILIFIINLVMIYQNFKSDHRVDELREALTKASQDGMAVARENQALLKRAVAVLEEATDEVSSKDD